MPENHNPKVLRMAAAYFMFQAAAVFSWWALLAFFPAGRRYFLLETNSETSLMSFWIADLFLLGLGSLVTSWLCFRNIEYLSIAGWFVTGALTYAALYCFAFALKTDVGWIGVLLMFAATIWSGVFMVGLSFGKQMFRKAGESSSAWILLKTTIQIIVIWSLILIVFPYLITIVEDKIGISRLQFPFQKPLAALTLIVISAFGIWAAVTMSRIGHGTPLPLDHAKRLVFGGPYGYVRNPMAVSGIGQGLAVALFFGSPLTVVYAFTGSLIWQWIFRPLEEADLEERFGAEYEDYRHQVKCWVPRMTPYQSDGAEDSSNSSVLPSGRM